MKARRDWVYFLKKLALGLLIFVSRIANCPKAVMYINVMDFILPVIEECR